MRPPLLTVVRSPIPAQWSALAQRPRSDDPSISPAVAEILASVRAHGDAAVREFSLRFDGAVPPSLRVSPQALREAAASAPAPLKDAVTQAIATLQAFHRSQCRPEPPVETLPGVVCSRRSVPLQRVGIYVPGGSAPLFSSLLMAAVPAQIAGCPEIVLATPGGKSAAINHEIALCAHLLGIDEVYLMGGAQAIAALAFGTESIRSVNKICGPGNRYVTEAKIQVFGHGVGIDLPAGPSEVLIIADESADPRFVAADLLAQAEHGPDSQVLLVTTSETLLTQVCTELATQLATLPRATIAEAALAESRALLFTTLDEAMQFSNLYAPEHLILAVADPDRLSRQVENAGSVFLGPWAAEALGDYASGTNHILPTNGTARCFSGVSVDTFVKKITFQHVTRTGLNNLGPTVTTMARAEGLEAHARAIDVRCDSSP